MNPHVLGTVKPLRMPTNRSKKGQELVTLRVSASLLTAEEAHWPSQIQGNSSVHSPPAGVCRAVTLRIPLVKGIFFTPWRKKKMIASQEMKSSAVFMG